MAFVTAVEIFQQNLIMRTVAMTILAVGDVSVLLGMADDTGKLFVLFFRGLLNLQLIGMAAAAQRIRHLVVIADPVRRMWRMTVCTTGISNIVCMRFFMTEIALRPHAVPFALMTVETGLRTVATDCLTQFLCLCLMTAIT